MHYPRLFLTTALLACLATGAFAQHTAIDPQPRDGDWWTKRHESMNARVAEGNVDLLFIGDSITHGWEGSGKEVWAEYYEDRNAVNLGISGDKTEHVLWRLDNGNLEGISPRAAVIMIGTNNWEQNSAPEIAEGITKIVEKLQTRIPDIKILLLGIFPRADKPKEFCDKLVEVNHTVANLADWQKIFFLDIGYAFLDETGALPESVMPDLLHPNEVGYQIWAKTMEPVLANILGDEPQDGPAWKPLFDGQSLTGWQIIDGTDNAWGAADGLLYTTPEGGGWLATEAEYADFELLLEFKTPEGGNSGVFIRAPKEGNPAFAGSEIQVLDDYADEYKDLQPGQYCGSIYATAAPSERVTRPAGEWQQMRIRAEGPEVQVWLNGTHIVEADLSQHEDKLADHPGLTRETGFIGLQCHGSRLDYRDLQIRELK
jgi:beta-glucosidase